MPLVEPSTLCRTRTKFAMHRASSTDRGTLPDSMPRLGTNRRTFGGTLRQCSRQHSLPKRDSNIPLCSDRPNITGTLFVGTVQCGRTPPSATGAFSQESETGVVGANWSGNLARVYTMSATRSTSIYGGASTVQPSTLRVISCIKI